MDLTKEQTDAVQDSDEIHFSETPTLRNVLFFIGHLPDSYYTQMPEPLNVSEIEMLLPRIVKATAMMVAVAPDEESTVTMKKITALGHDQYEVTTVPGTPISLRERELDALFKGGYLTLSQEDATYSVVKMTPKLMGVLADKFERELKALGIGPSYVRTLLNNPRP